MEWDGRGEAGRHREAQHLCACVHQSATSRTAGSEARCRVKLCVCRNGVLLWVPSTHAPTWLEQRVVTHHRLPPHFAVHPSLGVPNDPVPAAQLHAVQGGAAAGARQAAAQRLLLLLGEQRKAHAAGRQAGGQAGGQAGRWKAQFLGVVSAGPAADCVFACRRHQEEAWRRHIRNTATPRKSMLC